MYKIVLSGTYYTVPGCLVLDPFMNNNWLHILIPMTAQLFLKLIGCISHILYSFTFVKFKDRVST